MMGQDFENPFGEKTLKGELKSMSAVLDGAVFPGTQGGPLEHVIASKAVAFREALEPAYETYAKQLIANANKMADAFVEKGYGVISGGTDNHLMLIDLRSKGVTGKQAENALNAAGITVNKNMVPFDDKSPFVTSGIRVGTPAITTRGLKEDDMPQIVEWIDEVISHHENPSQLNKIHEAVKNKMYDIPMFAW